MSAADDTRRILGRYLDAILAGDRETMADSFAEDATWWLHGDLPVAGTWRGRAAIVDDFLAGVGGRFDADTRTFTFGEPLIDGPTAVLEWRVQATAVDTGAAYDNSYCAVFETDGERISAVREYMDTRELARVIYPSPE